MDKHYCPYCMTPLGEDDTCPACGLTSGTYKPSPHHLPPGTVLSNRYLIGRVLGEGGFGITYIGCDLRLDVKVAIKEYYPREMSTRNASASLSVTSFMGPSQKNYERGKQKFLREAKIMAKMEKQHTIVSARDHFEENNTAYIVMEYVDGTTFREYVESKGGGIPPDELFPLIKPLFKALSIVHENGLIHRDISPDNLMLENGQVRLLDFGCARDTSTGDDTMSVAVKPGYAPVEQYQRKGQGPWTDIYALCATIYFCLTGKKPPQSLDRIAEDGLIPPRKLGVPISEQQEAALLKGLDTNPKRRLQTVDELRAKLYPGPPPPPPLPPLPWWERLREALKGKTSWLGIGAAVIILVIIAVSFGLISSRTPDDPDTETIADTADMADPQETWDADDEIREIADSEQSLFEDAVHVTTVEELDQAIKAGDSIVIDADLTLEAPLDSVEDAYEDFIDVTRPLAISEGVTVSLKGAVKDSEGSDWTPTIIVNDGGYLFNHGTICGGVKADSSARVINYGEFTYEPEVQRDHSVDFYNESILLNYGIIYANCFSGFNGDRFYNMGEFYAYDLDLGSGIILNQGTLTVTEPPSDQEWAWVCVHDGASFTNAGTLLIESGGDFMNQTICENTGEIRAESGSVIDNVALNNRGKLILEDGIESGYSLSRSGFYGDGEFDLGDTAATVYSTAGYESDREKRKPRTAASVQELNDLMKDDATDAVAVDTELTVDQDLVLTKDLYLDGQLTVKDGGSLTVKDAVVYLGSDSSRLGGKNISLTENTKLILGHEKACIALEKGDSLTLEQSIVCGRGGASIDGAELTLKKHSVFVPQNCETVNQASLTASSNSLLFFRGSRLTESSADLQNATCLCSTYADWKKCSLNVGAYGLFLSTAGTSRMTDCTVEIAENGTFENNQPTGLYGDSKFTNNGRTVLGTDDELTLEGTILNQGSMEVGNTNTNISISGEFENRGELRGPRESLEDLPIKGNPPVYDDE